MTVIQLVDYGAFDALAQDASFTLRSPNVQVDASEWSSVTNGGLGLARSIRVAVFSVCLPKCMVQHGPDTARLTIRYKGRTCWDGDTPVTRLVCIVNKVICLAYAPGAVLE
ncbi:MAG: hypothetical protein KVP17_002120 [Porospora cf. gigantea B]|uniref:uncharacterized protein n=1 Tax=Porospora cf. gigantea B TaxID=2853592 RepID=UPI003571E14C|nr:MAG: hypothetical protein KVP17_002120 [Porospora cf. gigantea B]